MTRDEYIKWLKQLDENLKFDGLIDVVACYGIGYIEYILAREEEDEENKILQSIVN